MARRPAIIFYYPKVSRYSVHALAGALETRPRFDETPVDFAPRHETLPETVAM